MLRFAGKLRHLCGKDLSNKVFIIGTGRSGTHWVGNIIGAHSDVRSTVEIEPIFSWVTGMALNTERVDDLYAKLARAYRVQHALSAPRHYLDKSHPNIWLAERLAATFTDALFVGVTRNPYATVASMLKHEGVRGWHEQWRDFPIPNKFLGITVENAGMYENLPLAAKCALRWKSHYVEMKRLQRALPRRLFVVEYESLFSDANTVLSGLSLFLGLKSEIPTPAIKTDSLGKWSKQLSSEEINQIERVVEMRPDGPSSF